MRYAGEIYGIPESRLAERHAVHIKSGPHEMPDTPQPRLEHDRWLVDCPCGSGVGVTRTGRAYCFACGAVMRVTLPSEVTRQAVESLLASRPERHRNWRPSHETLDDLRVENLTHGG
jgi:hypothetical protein